MGYLIEITEKKAEKLSEHLEEGLRHIGKAMQCVDEWMEENGMSERGRMNYRDEGRHSYGRYGNRNYMERGGYGNREDDDDEEYEHYQRMNERRRRDSMGRYR
jgi:hypothetical protein